jgi:hypothetical protein
MLTEQQINNQIGMIEKFFRGKVAIYNKYQWHGDKLTNGKKSVPATSRNINDKSMASKRVD